MKEKKEKLMKKTTKYIEDDKMKLGTKGRQELEEK